MNGTILSFACGVLDWSMHKLFIYNIVYQVIRRKLKKVCVFVFTATFTPTNYI